MNYFNYLSHLRSVTTQQSIFNFYIGNNCGSKKKPYAIITISRHKNTKNFTIRTDTFATTHKAANFLRSRTKEICDCMKPYEIKEYNKNECWLREVIRG